MGTILFLPEVDDDNLLSLFFNAHHFFRSTGSVVLTANYLFQHAYSLVLFRKYVLLSFVSREQMLHHISLK